MRIRERDLKQWHVGQKCRFGLLIGTIIEIDVNHICPILWKVTYLDQTDEIRFYANGEVCSSIREKLLKPV